MRTLKFTILLALVVLMGGVPAGTPADIIGTITPGGPPVTVTISAAGDNARLTFTGTAGQRVSMIASASNLTAPGLADASILKPDGSVLGQVSSVTNAISRYLDTRTLPVDGTYTVLFDPRDAATGNGTITLYDVPADVAGTVVPGGPAVSAATTVPGQNARWTFTGTAGQRVSMIASASNLTAPGLADASILKPDGSVLGQVSSVTNAISRYLDTRTLPVDGTYTVLFDPRDAATGNGTITLYDVPADFSSGIELDLNAVLVILSVPGQNGSLLFSGTAGQQVYLNRGGATITKSNVRILRPDGSTLIDSGLVGTLGASQSAQLPTSGTYTAIVDGYSDSTGTMTLSLTSSAETIAGLIDDQTPQTGSDAPLLPASATPISPIGPAPPGSYTTELWEASETGIDDGLKVVTSTAIGKSAITGVAKTSDGDDAIVGATVTFESPAITLTSTTSSTGAWAFIDVPPGTYTTRIIAQGLGLYQLTNSLLGANKIYQLTAPLTAEPQTFDDAAASADAAQQTQPTPPGSAYSHTHVPPSIRVGMYDIYPSPPPPGGVNCAEKDVQPSPIPVVRYPLDYYMLRVAKAEVEDRHYNAIGQKAALALIQNYAWLHKTLGGAFDVRNSISHQCFRDYAAGTITDEWRTSIRDVLDERMIGSNNQLLETLYLGGDMVECNDPAFPVGGGVASQRVIQALSEPSYACPQRTDWRDIAVHFYNDPRVVAGAKPRVTSAWATVSNGLITFNFQAKVADANVAWKFRVQRRTSTGWREVRFVGWRFNPLSAGGCSVEARSVPNCATPYEPPDGGCYVYRVEAGNPVGWSLGARFTQIGKGLSTTGPCDNPVQIQ